MPNTSSSKTPCSPPRRDIGMSPNISRTKGEYLSNSARSPMRLDEPPTLQACDETLPMIPPLSGGEEKTTRRIPTRTKSMDDIPSAQYGTRTNRLLRSARRAQAPPEPPNNMVIRQKIEGDRAGIHWTIFFDTPFSHMKKRMVITRGIETYELDEDEVQERLDELMSEVMCDEPKRKERSQSVPRSLQSPAECKTTQNSAKLVRPRVAKQQQQQPKHDDAEISPRTRTRQNRSPKRETTTIKVSDTNPLPEIDVPTGSRNTGKKVPSKQPEISDVPVSPRRRKKQGYHAARSLSPSPQRKSSINARSAAVRSLSPSAKELRNRTQRRASNPSSRPSGLFDSEIAPLPLDSQPPMFQHATKSSDVDKKKARQKDKPSAKELQNKRNIPVNESDGDDSCDKKQSTKKAAARVQLPTAYDKTKASQQDDEISLDIMGGFLPRTLMLNTSGADDTMLSSLTESAMSSLEGSKERSRDIISNSDHTAPGFRRRGRRDGRGAGQQSYNIRRPKVALRQPSGRIVSETSHNLGNDSGGFGIPNKHASIASMSSSENSTTIDDGKGNVPNASFMQFNISMADHFQLVSDDVEVVSLHTRLMAELYQRETQAIIPSATVEEGCGRDDHIADAKGGDPPKSPSRPNKIRSRLVRGFVGRSKSEHGKAKKSDASGDNTEAKRRDDKVDEKRKNFFNIGNASFNVIGTSPDLGDFGTELLDDDGSIDDKLCYE